MICNIPWLAIAIVQIATFTGFYRAHYIIRNKNKNKWLTRYIRIPTELPLKWLLFELISNLVNLKAGFGFKTMQTKCVQLQAMCV